jgi:hypothetical protein
VQDDLLNLDRHAGGAPELIVCMTDTILHLDSADNVAVLFAKAFDALERGGRFIITFRDLSTELEGLDRFIPVRSDENLILTCFLEYEPRTVKVHDLVYRRTGDGWALAKSYYRKLRLSRVWVETALTGAGFRLGQSAADAGLITIVAARD